MWSMFVSEGRMDAGLVDGRRRGRTRGRRGTHGGSTCSDRTDRNSLFCLSLFASVFLVWVIRSRLLWCKLTCFSDESESVQLTVLNEHWAGDSCCDCGGKQKASGFHLTSPLSFFVYTHWKKNESVSEGNQASCCLRVSEEEELNTLSQSHAGWIKNYLSDNFDHLIIWTVFSSVKKWNFHQRR